MRRTGAAHKRVSIGRRLRSTSCLQALSSVKKRFLQAAAAAVAQDPRNQAKEATTSGQNEAVDDQEAEEEVPKGKS